MPSDRLPFSLPLLASVPQVGLWLLALALVSCERPATRPLTDDVGTVSGVVVKGRVAGASVRVFRLSGAERGAEVGRARTAEDGTFRVGVGAAVGPFLVVASGGQFIDEATGALVPLNAEELTALVPDFPVATHLQGLAVSPISHLTAGLALRYVRAEGQPLPDAHAEASAYLHAHFGGLDWAHVTPTDLTTTAATTLDDSARAGLLLAALSMQARTISEAAGLTPGVRVTALTLAQALYQDLTADGFFDGASAQGTLLLPAGAPPPQAYRLDGDTVRAHLAQAAARFLDSERNAARAIRPADIQTLATALSANANSRLFRGPGRLADISPPALTWESPVPDSGVTGQVTVAVRATDSGGLQALRFTAPPQLAGLPAAAGSGSALLSGTLDVSALPDGPLTLTAVSEDASGNRATSSITVTVANRGPAVTVTYPAEGATVRGTVLVTATAVGQQGPVRRLELRDAPPGVGPDTLPAADSFAATWDTTQAPEGEAVLRFHAEDLFGAAMDFPVRVRVDNVPYGTVHVTVSAGNPVAGATVRLVAQDAAGTVLGVGGPTQADGTVSFSLTGENWDGPVQLQVTSASALSYVDPSDGVSPVSIPAAMRLTSLLPRYRTGDTLTAPVTLYTTLADAAALAYSQGRNPALPASPLPEALAVTAPLFERHVAGGTPWTLWATVPAPLTQPPARPLGAAVFAALPDVSLNQLARRIAVSAGLTPVQGFDAVKLLSLLQRDVSDGRFDGREGGLLLRVPGAPTYELSADELRVRLAVALDAFITSPHNRTGLTRADLRSAEPRVYDALSLDTSSLFAPDVPPTPFDVNPPAVLWRVSFTGHDGIPRTAPVGPSRLVANALAIEATAVDSEGADARLLTVTVGGLFLSNEQRGPATVSGTWVPGADGPLELVAMAEDALGNRATSRSTVRVDNTPPVLSPTSPVAGAFHGVGAVPLACTATDDNGVDTHTLSRLAGASYMGLASLVGSWLPPVSQADGRATGTFTACDPVGNCASRDVDFYLDRAPPTLTFVDPPPAYTNADRVTFRIAATDAGAGVLRVLGRKSTDQAPVEATLMDGVWTLTLAMGGDLEPAFLFWGVDAALPGNSGELLPGAPYRLQAKVTRDTVPPTVSRLTGADGGQYQSEEFIRPVETEPGKPTVPFVPAGLGTKSDILPGGAIYKATTRLEPGALDAWELRTANAANVPWLGIHAQDSSLGAPIAVRYVITCEGCGAPTKSEGDLLAWNGPTSPLTHLLPLTADTVPGLRNTTAARVTLWVTVAATDAAGNVSNPLATQLDFHLVTPRPSIEPQPYGMNNGDPLSLYHYTLGRPDYDRLWAPNDDRFARGMRVAKYVVRNPYPVPLVVNITTEGQATAVLEESWASRIDVDTTTTPVEVDGYSFAPAYVWDSTGLHRVCAASPAPRYPCITSGFPGEFIEYPTHVMRSQAQWTCTRRDTLPPPLERGTTSVWESVGYIQEAGAVEVEAPASVSLAGRAAWRVPAATATTPGVLNLYVLVQRMRGALPPLVLKGGAYEYLHALDYSATALAASCIEPASEEMYSSYRHTRRLLMRKLLSARFSGSAPLTLNAQATHAAGGGTFPVLGVPGRATLPTLTVSHAF